MGIQYFEGYEISCDNIDYCDKKTTWHHSEMSCNIFEEDWHWEQKALEKEGWIFTEDHIFCCKECQKEWENS